jgi:hypothetical protein
MLNLIYSPPQFAARSRLICRFFVLKESIIILYLCMMKSSPDPPRSLKDVESYLTIWRSRSRYANPREDCVKFRNVI